MPASKPAEKVLKPLLAAVLAVLLCLSNEEPRRINGGSLSGLFKRHGIHLSHVVVRRFWGSVAKLLRTKAAFRAILSKRLRGRLCPMAR